MTLKHFLTTAAATASLALVMLPTTASAQSTAAGSGRAAPRSAQAADGLLHAWTLPGGGGTPCFWGGNSDNWGPCRNAASDIWNNGYAVTLDAVDLYWGLNATGAHACISRGDSWNNLPSGQWKFTYGAGLGGFGQSIDNNISSHRWVDYCSQG
ncbi:hypothetical protein [Streptomyces sp. NBC_01190]|uniref:hypothetical protein n=1 Tax=Streptomyces sp. NBC_01190 TaxID=2903767 RepID=UPI00386F9189|nr:hypothetical protein OG519_30655 [Streptomyces sp. NBC_01190]